MLTFLVGNLQLAYFTVEVTLCRAILRTAAGPQLRSRSATLVSNIIHWLKNLQVNRLSSFWWIGKFVALQPPPPTTHDPRPK